MQITENQTIFSNPPTLLFKKVFKSIALLISNLFTNPFLTISSTMAFLISLPKLQIFLITLTVISIILIGLIYFKKIGGTYPTPLLLTFSLIIILVRISLLSGYFAPLNSFLNIAFKLSTDPLYLGALCIDILFIILN